MPILSRIHYPPPLIYTEDWEIDSRLVPFQVSRPELVEIARAVQGARADSVENDPATAEGQFAYIYGTRYTRAAWRRKGWLLYRENNIESVRHPTLDWKIIYQNVDIAASLEHEPRAVSGKKSGSERLIDVAQGNLFPPEQFKEKSGFKQTNAGIWFYCVSVKGDDVRAELSLPLRVANGNFEGFAERIFIVRGGEWPELATMPLPEGGVTEFEPVVTRKK
jgi:hypothetical protein